MRGNINNWFISGNLTTGIFGNTMNTPPLSSASNACSNALPTSSTVRTLILVFFSIFSISVVSLTRSVSANQGHSAYAFIWSSSHGFGRAHFAYDLQNMKQYNLLNIFLGTFNMNIKINMKLTR